MISEPIPFFANVALMARVDGKLSPSEVQQLEELRAELNIKKGDFNKAVSLVEKGAHAVTPVGTFSDQVKNLELMLRVAYSDDDLDETESRIISDFCKMIGVYQDQLEKMAAEIVNSLAQRKRSCSACGAPAEPDARFCPKCGAALASDAPAVQLEFEVPPSGLAIQFAESSAAGFLRAIEAAKVAGGYQTCQRAKKTWHMAVFPSGALADALPLVEALSGFRNRRVFENGEEKVWDEVFGFVWCAERQRTAYKPVEYCFGKDENRLNPWGCRQAQMDWSAWTEWFSYGAWERGGTSGADVVWRFDKERIRHQLATNLFRFRFCPHMCAGLPEAILRHLPDTVAPHLDGAWAFNRDYDESPGSIKVVESAGSGEFSYENEFWSNGVRPKGLGILPALLERAFADIGGCGISAQELVR